MVSLSNSAPQSVLQLLGKHPSIADEKTQEPHSLRPLQRIYLYHTPKKQEYQNIHFDCNRFITENLKSDADHEAGHSIHQVFHITYPKNLNDSEHQSRALLS